VDEFARALRTVLTNPVRRECLRRSASRFYERYSWEVMKHNLFAAVDE